MLGALDHVGYLAADLDGAVEEFAVIFSLPFARTIDLPQFSITGVYLGSGTGSVEVFTITDPALLQQRLGGQRILLDHVAHEVDDIDAVAAVFSRAGVRFSGPDRREQVSEPFDIGGVRHLWTLPESSCGQSIQILQR